MSSTFSASLVELQSRPRPPLPQLAPPFAEPVLSSTDQQDRVSQDPRDARQCLAPADRGAAAWRLLGAAFVFEALLWGKSSTLHAK